MKPTFSLKYNGNPVRSSELSAAPTEKGERYVIDESLVVSLEKKEYADASALEWVLYFENPSSHNSGILSEICDADFLLALDLPTPPASGYRPSDGDVAVITMKGMVDGKYYWENDAVSATEYALSTEYLDKERNKTKRFANTSGRSSEGMLPFFDVTAKGSGYLVAIGWTGDWQAEFSGKPDGVCLRSGLKETAFYLVPGERIRTSCTLVMPYAADEDKYNKFRRLLKNHISHKASSPSSRESLMAFELWGGLTSEEMKKRIREFSSHGVSFEDVWIDAAWYGECENCESAFNGDWSNQTGDWTPNPRVHPAELRDVAEVAGEAGMRLMLWLEPERARVGTRVLAEHPEWFLSHPYSTGDKILSYGNEEAWAYVHETIRHYVKDLGLSCYRQDFNAELTSVFRAADPENRRGITEIKHITGMYRLWDALREEFPELLIDNCSSGGRRIDIETLRRSIPFFRSDYQCNFNEEPEVLQTHNANASLYFPYIGCTSKTKGDTYAIRSSYASSWGGAFYNAVFQSMDESDFAWAKRITDEYRSIRRYFSCDFYSHGSSTFDPTSWAIFQYHDPASDSGIVMAFRRSRSPFASVDIALAGLVDGGEYRTVNLNDGSESSFSDSLTITLAEKRSSVILRYQKER